MAGPNAGTCGVQNLERYILPTVTVAPTGTDPTTATTVTRLGQPTPGANNRSDVSLGLLGDIKADAAAPSVILKIMDLGRAPGNAQSRITGFDLRRLERAQILHAAGKIDTSRFLKIASRFNFKDSLQGGDLPEEHAPVPRFAVTRTGPINDSNIYKGVRESFIRAVEADGSTTWDDVVAKPTAGHAGDWSVVDQPRLWTGLDGAMYMAFLSRRTASPWTTEIVVKRFHPATDNEWVHYTETTSDFHAVVDKTATQRVALALCPVVYGRETYILVLAADASLTDFGESPNPRGVGHMYVFHLVGTSLEIVQTTSRPLSVRLPEVWLLNGGSVQNSWADVGFSAVASDDGVLVTIGLQCAGFCGRETSRTIVTLNSSDMVTWGPNGNTSDDPNHEGPLPVVRSLSEFSEVPFPSGATVNRIARSGDVLFGATSEGSIAYSNDAGRSWTLQSTPCSASNRTNSDPIALFGVYAVSDLIAYACGESGVVIRTIDGGKNWYVIRYADGIAGWGPNAFSGDTGGITFDNKLPAVALYGITVETGGANHRVFVAGAGGYTGYCSSADWADWITLTHPKSLGSYLDIVHYTNNTTLSILAVGDAAVHEFRGAPGGAVGHRGMEIRFPGGTIAADPSESNKRYVLSIYHASYPDTTFPQNLTSSCVRAKVVEVNNGAFNGTVIFVLDRAGNVYAVDGDQLSSGAASYEYYMRIGDGYDYLFQDFDIVDVSLANDENGNDDVERTVMTALYRSRTNPRPGWARQDNFIQSTYNPLDMDTTKRTALWRTARFSWIADKNTVLNAISALDGDRAAVLGKDTAMYSATNLGDRCFPDVVRLRSGAILLACMNVTTEEIEIWKAQDIRSPFQRTAITFSAELDSPWAGFAADLPSDARRPVLTMSTTGECLLTYSDDTEVAYVSPPESDGMTWYTGTSKNVTLPLLHMPDDAHSSLYAIRRQRHMIDYGGGRLYAVVAKERSSQISATIRTYVARDFAAQSNGSVETHYVPIIPGVPQWIGVGNTRVVFNGMPAVGDTFTILPEYDYPVANLTTAESPRLHWRSSTSSYNNGSGVVYITFDRQSTDVVSALGPGTSWEVSTLAVFGGNVQTLGLSVSSNGTPSSASYTSVTQSIATGTAAHPSGSGTVYDVLYDSSRTGATEWVPHQWAPHGNRKWYVRIASSGAAYEIVDNSRNTITIKNQSTGLGSSPTYTVFSDKMVVYGTNLNDGVSRFNRYVHIRIPAQQVPTTDGCYKLGTVILGTYVDYDPHGSSTESRHRFSTGFSWQPMPSTIASQGMSGVSVVEHLGYGSRWTLPYNAAQAWDRDMTINGLLPRMRQAFALQFDGSDTSSIELVRLVDGPVFENSPSENRWSYTLQLEEVV